METVNTDDVDGEKGRELRSAFGEDTEVVKLDTDDLEPAETPDYVLHNVLEEGDWVTIQHKAGNVTTGPVEEVDDISVTIDPRNRTTSGYFGFSTLGVDKYETPLDTPGDEPHSVLIDINGRPAHEAFTEGW